ncbi:hypothetical protein [Desulfovirgula thermocuniculi]|uniref:hypothetical protein n=1 Tax=Desulfovirgula thermocuniculi TaxID=348842 RepID=UPI0003F4E855|nr:hypothetical protein [Desulfovirgula thermocuniculi]
MSPEKRELALASVLGLLAGPTYLAAGPERFLTWYAVVLGGGVFSTAHWLREIKPSRAAWLTWLAWPFALLSGAAVSLLGCAWLKVLVERW